MNINNISIPEIYQTSADFRVFIKWISLCFSRLQYDIENMSDLYDALRCPSNLLWMLADTMGYKYDDRFSSAYIRLVLLYFMSLIRNRGSKDGVTLAAELNLAQFIVDKAGKEHNINYDRLENTSIPVNSAYVIQHTEAAYIDVVYFSDVIPIDACIEYVRPLGMYCFQHAGVRYDASTKISVDAKLADYVNSQSAASRSITATHVGHYRRSDYASMQKTSLSNNDDVEYYVKAPSGELWAPAKFYKYDVYYNRYIELTRKPDDFNSENYYYKLTAKKISIETNDIDDTRHAVWYRNSKYEVGTNDKINPGYRAISSLQLCNNDNVVKSLIHNKIFDIGLGYVKSPPDQPWEEGKYYDYFDGEYFEVIYASDFHSEDYYILAIDTYEPDSNLITPYNLLYDTLQDDTTIVQTLNYTYVQDQNRPIPMINPIMATIGDAIPMTIDGTDYHTKVDSTGDIDLVEDNPSL